MQRTGKVVDRLLALLGHIFCQLRYISRCCFPESRTCAQAITVGVVGQETPAALKGSDAADSGWVAYCPPRSVHYTMQNWVVTAAPCLWCCCHAALQSTFTVLGEGCITPGDKCAMLPPGPDPNQRPDLNLAHADSPTAQLAHSPPNSNRALWTSQSDLHAYPLEQWPTTWLRTVQEGMRAKDGQICVAIKSVPFEYIQKIVTDSDERQQLVQFAQEQQDLDIHLQVSFSKQ